MEAELAVDTQVPAQGLDDSPDEVEPYAWTAPKPLYESIQRILDLAVASAVLVVLSPFWLVLAILIKMTSAGPVIHSVPAVGRHGRPFHFFKFRSMVVADDSVHRHWIREFVLRDLPYSDGHFKVIRDPRITRVGRFIRLVSLDEVPQFVNVIRGEMSVVGPRPPVEYEFELYDHHKKRRLMVRPGITGLYQVTARSKVPFSKMLEIDLDYISRRSVWLDLQIMLRTAVVMATGRGAA
jgi:lipopolysaccharide/colanic/teichoic acid biosynthesis glycosyltransferase